MEKVIIANNPSSLTTAINTSAKWLNTCNALIDGAPLDDSTRNRVSASLLHLSIEHHGATRCPSIQTLELSM